jgi:Xaa-Pro aminopeptidase
MDPAMKDLVSFGLEAHIKTFEWMKPGIPAKEVVINFEKFVRDRGYGDNLLYGPCHGLGMIEVERPWMEGTSDYLLQENMTFQVDTFLYRKEYGLRWETGSRITADGVADFSNKFRGIYELG